MSYTINGKVYRNLQEQVYENTKDIEALHIGGSSYGIVAAGPYANTSAIPAEIIKLDAFYLIGASEPYHLYKCTDADAKTYSDLGEFGTGKEGPQGPTGAPGSSIQSITKTATVGLVDTYTVTLTNGTTTTFNVTNGAKGDKGDKGDQGTIITDIKKISSRIEGDNTVSVIQVDYDDSTTDTFEVAAANGVGDRVSVSSTGTSSDKVYFITVNGVEHKLAGGIEFTTGDGITLSAQNVLSVDDTIATKTYVDDSVTGLAAWTEVEEAVSDAVNEAKTYTDTECAKKQDAIADLATIRSNAEAGKAASDEMPTKQDLITDATSLQAQQYKVALRQGQKANLDYDGLAIIKDNVNQTYYQQGKIAVVDSDSTNTLTLPKKTDTIATVSDIPTAVSALTNDAGYVTTDYHDDTKQDVLIAGTGIDISNNTVTNTLVDNSAPNVTIAVGDSDRINRAAVSANIGFNQFRYDANGEVIRWARFEPVDCRLLLDVKNESGTIDTTSLMFTEGKSGTLAVTTDVDNAKAKCVQLTGTQSVGGHKLFTDGSVDITTADNDNKALRVYNSGGFGIYDAGTNGTRTAFISLPRTAGTLALTSDLDTKLDKITTADTYARLYGISAAGGQTSYPLTSGNIANTIASRNANGQINVADPTAQAHCANVRYIQNCAETFTFTLLDGTEIEKDIVLSPVL